MGQLFPGRPASGPGGGSVLLLQVADVQAGSGSAGWGGGAWSGQSHDNASYPGAQRDDATLSGPVTSAGWELLAPRRLAPVLSPPPRQLPLWQPLRPPPAAPGGAAPLDL